jgi:hypothetical protein
MTRTPTCLLLASSLAGVACSRGVLTADDGPRAATTASGIPAAASSARLAPSGSFVAATTATITGSSGGTVELSPSGAASGVTPLPPRIHDDGASVSSAALPPEVIRRIVRQNFGRFRLCYESALRMDPTLTGSVKMRFVIEPDGAVGTVSDAGSLIGDAGMLACIQRAFGRLAFPEPTGGAMTVTYSLSFTPS